MQKDTSLSWENIENKCVSSDATFYICFADDLGRKEWLYMLMKFYSFYIGKRILAEISRSKTLCNDIKFCALVKVANVDYYELVRPYFGRKPKHIDDGEYEAIGIAHFLYLKGCLHYLIIDESRARNFVNTHFKYLADKMVGTVGFIRDCCIKDKILDSGLAIDILTAIKNKIEQVNNRKRVCGLCKKDYKKLVAPILEKFREVKNERI